MSYHINIYTETSSLENIWDAYLAPDSNMRLHLLQDVATSKIRHLEPLYIQVTDAQQQTVALLYAQILRIVPQFINLESLSNILMFATKTLLTCKNIKLLVLGHLFRHDDNYMHFASAISLAEKQEIIQACIETLSEKYKTKATFLKDLPADIATGFKEQDSYNRFKNDVGMQLQIPAEWQSFEDYEQALKHKYVQRLRKTKKAFKNVTVKELSLQEIEVEKESLFGLYQQVCKNQNITLGLLNADYFVAFKKSMQHQLVVHAFYFENKMVAFSTAIFKGKVFDMNYIGIDYSYNSKLQLYFNMLFYFVEQAITRQCEHLFLGRTALEAKAIIGCKPVTLCGYYKINNGFLSRITTWFTNKESTEQGEQWKDRHPFKSEYYA